MKKLTFLLPLLLFLSFSVRTEAAPPARADSLTVVFWNLENLFDADASNGGEEFSPSGEKGWTEGRFEAKVSAVGTALSEIRNELGALPDVIAVCEIENRGVMQALADSPFFLRAGYDFVHFESPDRRGIDTGLFYRRERLSLLRGEALPVKGLRTRDILLCEFKGGFAVLVNHHPSKRGGAQHSEASRMRAVSTLAAACEACGKSVLAVGDFNDTPEAPAFEALEKAGMRNLSLLLAAAGNGTYKWDGKWSMLDQAWADETLAPRCRFAVAYPPSALEKDRYNGGVRPKRTYSGGKYTGGVSDHLPIVVRVAKR